MKGVGVVEEIIYFFSNGGNRQKTIANIQQHLKLGCISGRC